MRRRILSLALYGLTLVCLEVGLSGHGYLPAHPFQTLLAHRGEDLLALPEEEMAKFLRAVTKLVPGRKYHSLHFDYAPWYFWEFGERGVRRSYVLFEVERFIAHPGSSPVRISVFDEGGKMVSETTFTTGHRRYLSKVELLPAGANEKPILVFRVGSLGPYRATQYYGWIGNGLDLIRVERADGQADRNDYCYPHFRCGPEPPPQKAAQWEADLESNDRATVLRALVWLGGRHRDARTEQGAGPHESRQDTELVQAVLRRYWVWARLRELSESDDPWLREAANLAFHPDGDDQPRRIPGPM